MNSNTEAVMLGLDADLVRARIDGVLAGYPLSTSGKAWKALSKSLREEGGIPSDAPGYLRGNALKCYEELVETLTGGGVS